MSVATSTSPPGRSMSTGAGVADVAEQSVADDEERTGGFLAPAPICPPGPVVGCTNCNLHAVGNGLAGGGARIGARARRAAGYPAAGRDAGRFGPERGATGGRPDGREREGDD